MSNTDAIRSALLNYSGSTNFMLDRLNPKKGGVGFVDGEPDADFFRERMQAKVVALSLWGNWYNTLGLIEYPEKFDFIYPHFDEEVETSRRIIPFTQIRRKFYNNIRHRLKIVSLFRSLTISKMFMIQVPPPIDDELHIREFPGPFRDELSNGIAPARIRMKLWKLQDQVYTDICVENGIEVLPFPDEAKNAAGFIAPDYRYKDPTHADIKYGHLVLSQLEAVHRSLS
jgi:hypothetical protein